MRVRRLVAPAVALGVLVAAAPAVADDEVPPADQRNPTAEQVADSIRVWDAADPRWVHVWDLDGFVTTLEQESTDGEETVITLDSDILFDFGSAAIGAEAAARVGELVADVPQGAAVSVSGHTDDVGDEASNQVLSQQRADAAAAVVTAARPDLVLTVRGFGETTPVAPNSRGGQDDPEGRAMNRRVEIRFVG